MMHPIDHLRAQTLDVHPHHVWLRGVAPVDDGLIALALENLARHVRRRADDAVQLLTLVHFRRLPVWVARRRGYGALGRQADGKNAQKQTALRAATLTRRLRKARSLLRAFSFSTMRNFMSAGEP